MGNREDLHAERVDSSDLKSELSPHFRMTCRSFDLRQENLPNSVSFKLNFYRSAKSV